MTLEEKIKNIIAPILGIKDSSDIDNNSRIVDDLRADSLDVIEIIMECEDSFDVQIDEAIFPHDVTVGKFIHEVADLLTPLTER